MLSLVHDHARRGNLSGLSEALNSDPTLLNAAGSLGNCALHWAAGAGHEDAVLLLLDMGAEIDAVNGEGDTALHLACWRGHKETVALLLERGASTSVRNKAGAVPADMARTALVGAAAVVVADEDE